MRVFAALRSQYVFWIALIVLGPILTTHLLADTSSATLSVRVADSSQAVIPDATVILRNAATNQKQQAQTNPAGDATFSFLKPGAYSLIVQKNLFAEVAISNIALNVGDERHIQVVMKIGPSAQTVQVDGSGPTINTADGSVSTVIDRQFVANMPLNGRSFQDLISMTPGVVTESPQRTSQNPGEYGDFSINGQRTESNYYILDGVSANTNTGFASGGNGPAQAGAVAAGSALGTTQTLLSVDALEEFRLNSSTYSAEFGRSPGGQISLLSRSGTNDLHGSAFDYLRNGWFDANDWFNDELGQPKQELHQNDFGGTLGGPIWIPRLYKGTDQTFFFGSYEGLRLTQPVAGSVQYVPDQYMREQAPPPVQVLLNAFPQQSPNGIDYGSAQAPSLAQFLQGYSAPGSIDSTSVRLDRLFTPKISSFFRFSYTPSSLGSRALSSRVTSEVNSTAYTVGTTFTINSKLTDEFRLGYTRGTSLYSSNVDNFDGATPIDLGPSMYAGSSLNGAVGEAGLVIADIGYTDIETFAAENKGRQWNVTDSIAMTLNKHQIKLGFDYRRISTIVSGASPSLYVEWDTAEQALLNAADFAYIEKQLDAASIFNQTALFAQDEWKINSALSLSVGLRWEVDPPPHSGNSTKPSIVLGNLAQPSTLNLSPSGVSLWKTPWWNFAPRLGVAWQLHNSAGRQTVVRGGGGLFFDTSNEAADYVFHTVGYSTLNEFEGTVPMPFTAEQNNFAVTTEPPYSLAIQYPSHLQLPYTLEWSAGLEQGLGQSQTFSITYVASAGRRLIQTQEISPSNHDFKEIDYIPGGGVTSNYQSLQAKFQRQVSRGLSALGSYTWSHSLDYGSNFNSLPLTYGNSDFDVRNNFQSGLTWELPHPYSASLRNHLLGGWALDVRFLARTAFPVTLQGKRTTDPGTGSSYYTNVDLVGGVPIYLYGSQYPGGRILNKGAFTLPLGSDPGNAARNFVRGFGANQLNVAVRRHFSLSEKLSLQFRAETFNLLNHPNFGYIDPILSDATFGYATQSLNQSLGTVASQYQQGGPRSMQFAMKVLF